MNRLLLTAFVIGVFAPQAFGQGAQADQIKRRAKELSNQNNVRQGVTPAGQPAAKPAAAPAPAATPAPARPATRAETRGPERAQWLPVSASLR